MQKKYWASDDTEGAVTECIDRIKRYQESLAVGGRLDNMRKAWECYRGRGPKGEKDASRITYTGVKGELLSVTVNQFAALVNQSVTLITANKPATKAIAKNNDFASLAEAQLADAVNDHYDREIGLSEVERQCVVSMVLFGESCEVANWNTSLGRHIGPSDAEQKPEGDVEAFSLTPLEYAYDPDVSDAKSRTWACFKRACNKYDLAAEFPDVADKLLAADVQNGIDIGAFGGSTGFVDFFQNSKRRSSYQDTDVVYVWELRHKRTPACPNGRLIRFVRTDCVLFDSRVTSEDGTVSDFGTPFRALEMEFEALERLPGSGDAITSFSDLLSLQEGIDLAASIMASAINAGGLQNMYVPRGANITSARLTGALNIIQYDGQQVPIAKDNVSISPVIGQWIDLQSKWMQQRVGLNDVTSGEPPKGMPAQGMALLRASAVEFHSGLQASYERLIQKGRTTILHLVQKFAKNDRVAFVAGKSNDWAVKYFNGDMVASFDRFVIEPVNPIMKTLAGKVGFAQPLLDSGKIKVQEYLQVVSTGRMDPILKAEQNNYARMQRDKELMMQGIGLPPREMIVDPVTGQQVEALDALGLPVFAKGEEGKVYVRPLLTDTHWVDIPEYLGVLSIPEIRGVDSVTKAVTEVVALKTKMFSVMPPNLIMMLGGPVPVPDAPPPPQLGGPIGPGIQGPGAPDVAEPKLPQPPKNPITNQQDLEVKM